VESSTFYRGVTIIFSLQLCRIKNDFYISRTSALVVCSPVKNRSSSFNVSWMNISHENKQLSIWSNISWLIRLKKALELEMLLFHLLPSLSHVPIFWNAPLNSIAGSDIRFMFALLASPKHCFTVFNKQGFTSVFPIVWVFCLVISSATSYDACLLGGNFRQDKSLTLHGVGTLHGVAWLGCFVSKCPYQFQRFHMLSTRAATTWYFRGGKWCNLLLRLTNTYVCENFGGTIARLPPSGCGPA